MKCLLLGKGPVQVSSIWRAAGCLQAWPGSAGPGSSQGACRRWRTRRRISHLQTRGRCSWGTPARSSCFSSAEGASSPRVAQALPQWPLHGLVGQQAVGVRFQGLDLGQQPPGPPPHSWAQSGSRTNRTHCQQKSASATLCKALPQIRVGEGEGGAWAGACGALL